MKYYFTLSLFVMVSSLCTAVLIVHISLKGTLINAYPRRHMPKLRFVKVMLCSYLYNFSYVFLLFIDMSL